MNPINLPYWSGNDGNLTVTTDKYPGQTLNNITHTNWALIIPISSNGPPGAVTAFFRRPCTFWFGKEYPFGAVYDRDPKMSGNILMDRWIFNLL
jgi:hypothetical protein